MLSFAFIAVLALVSVVVISDVGVDVFTVWEGGYPCIRIPSITQTPSGTLVAFAECRGWIGDGCDPQGIAKDEKIALMKNTNDRWVCSKRSTDGGQTWSDLSYPVGKRTRPFFLLCTLRCELYTRDCPLLPPSLLH